MRMMLSFTIPAEAGNAAIREGRIGKVLQGLAEQIKPEAAYFYTPGTQRGGFFVFEMKDPSDMPALCEPLFMELNANVDLHPVMSMDDVVTGLKKAGYG